MVRRVIEVEFFEVLMGFVGFFEEDLMFFVKYEGFVEKVVCVLGSLVDGNVVSVLEKVVWYF